MGTDIWSYQNQRVRLKASSLYVGVVGAEAHSPEQSRPRKEWQEVGGGV